MSQYIRSFAGVVLAVVLAVTGLSVAQARVQAGPAGALVICRGLTVVTILVDAEGQPVERAHICPDAALALFVAAGVTAPQPPLAVSWDRIDWPVVDGVRIARHARAARARGPPLGL